MANSVVGALRVVLGMDAGEFSKGSKKAGDDLDKLRKRASQAGKAIGAAFAVAAGAVAASMAKALVDFDEFTKASQKIGVPVEQLSALSHAADLSGVAFDGLTTGFKKLSQNMSEFAGGNTTGTASRAFKALGISVTDAAGNLRTSNDVMIDVAERFKGMEDGAGKTALAVAIFGRAGADLIPLLNAGRDGIKGMTDEADQLGLVMSGKAANAAERFNDGMDKLGKVFTGIGRQIMVELGPAFANLIESLVGFIKQSGFVQAAASAIANGFKFIVDSGFAAAAAIRRLRDNLATFFENAKSLVTGNFDEIAKRNDALFERMRVAQEQSLQAQETRWSDSIEAQAATAATYQEKVAAPIIQSTERMAAAQRVANEALREQERLINQGVKLVEGTRSPAEVLAEKAKVLDAALAANKISAEQFGAAMQKATAVSLNAYAGMASGIANNLATAFGNSKAFAIAAAIINTAESVTKTLATYGATPWGFAAAAAAAAAGAAQIATIKSAGKGGGGSSGGGAGGAGATATAAAQPVQQQSFSINLQGETFGRDQVRGLIESINDAISDGAVLRVAA